MPSRDWQNRVRDVLAAIAEIREFTNEITFEEFQNDRKTIRAVLYNLAIIGEAVRSIPLDVEASHPEIPWGDVRGMRNIVIHEYFQVNLSIIWQTVQEDLVSLEASLQQLINP
ncbi:HepT-like ribonuclease domain-containing protein [Leptodesmis sp.]|uniref:HepT-like ribonuclease domain-containing protein n=1 Tax=Leptodesmis sp. TaxID=3100501 RepID=UPI0040535904